LGLAGAPASQSIAAALPGAKVCILTPQAVEGPFYFDPKLVRADITEGKPGAPLKLTLQVVEAKDCARLEGARVDVWHSDGLGVYSGYARQETGSTRGETFLRGTQFTDADGQVRPWQPEERTRQVVRREAVHCQGKSAQPPPRRRFEARPGG